MADVVAIAGGPEQAKVRSVFAPALLPFITFGIYFFVWWFKINRELATLGRKHGREDLGTSPGLSLVAMLFGWILIVPPLFSAVGTWRRMKRAQELTEVPEIDRGNGVLAVVLYIVVSIVFVGYLQNELNKVWRRQGGGAPAATDGGGTSVGGLPGIPATPAASPTSLPGIPGG